MDSAHSGDLIPVAAKDIGKIEGWKKLKWQCLGCPARVFAVACDPDKKFDRVPHFSLKQGHGKHADDCDVAGLNVLIKKARKKEIQSHDILLGYLPHSVDFRDSVSKIEEPRAKPNRHSANIGSSNGTCAGKPTRFHRPSRSSIEPVCRAHAALRDGELREAISLNVPGCLGSNYRDTFYQLQDIRSGAPPALHGCIFYGELRFTSKPKYDDTEKLILTLNRGIRSDGNRPERLYRLVVRWQNWREQLRALFVKEIETKRLATGKRYFAADRDRRKPFKSDILIYFLGQQVDGSQTDFEISDFRKVAIVVEPNGIYKDYPNHIFFRPAPPEAARAQQQRAEPEEPPAWVTSDFDDCTPEPKRPDPPVAQRRRSTPEQSIAGPTAPTQNTPVVTDHYPRVGGSMPTCHPPEPKARTGVLGWLKSLTSRLFE